MYPALYHWSYPTIPEIDMRRYTNRGIAEYLNGKTLHELTTVSAIVATR